MDRLETINGMAYALARKTTRPPQVNKRYFQHRLQDVGLSQAELAKLMDLNASDVSRSFSGKRRFTTHETAQLARILRVPLDDVLNNLAVELPSHGGTEQVSVVGEITTLGEVRFGQPAGPRKVETPLRESAEGLQALRCSGGGALEGAYIYYREAKGLVPDAMGRLCVCFMGDGKLLLGTPRSGSRRDVYTVHSITGEILRADTWLLAASPVVWIKPA